MGILGASLAPLHGMGIGGVLFIGFLVDFLG